MKCPVCDKNQIDPSSQLFMCLECWDEDMKLFDENVYISWAENMDNPDVVSVIYDEDDYGVNP